MTATEPTSPALLRRRATNLVAWLPLAIIVLAIAASWYTGASPVASSQAATTVGVSGELPSNIYLDASGCAPAAVAIGDLVPGTDPWKTAQDAGGQACAVSFGTTNHSPGTTLSMLEDPSAAASPAAAMKCVGPGCTGSALADYSGSAEPSPGTSAFGAQLVAAPSGITTALWAPAPAVQAVGAASPACATASVGTGSCSFTWGATASTSDTPGAYQALAQLVVLAN